MEIEQINITELKAYEKNTKLHPEEQVERIAESIKEFGFNIPVLIDKHNVLIAGHGRLAAAHKLGLEVVPAIRKTDLTSEQIKAFRIADNKVAESGWDYDFLREEFEFLNQANYDLAFTGFNQEEITDFFDKNEIKPEKEIEDAFSLENKCPKCDYEW